MQEKNRRNLAKIVIIFLGILTPSFIFLGPLKGPIYSATSDTVNLQGKIVRNDTGYEGLNVTAGNPSCVVTGSGNDTCDFRIRYYDSSTAGNLLLTEQFSNIEIGQYLGVFNLSLGSDSAPVAGVYSSLSALIQGENDVYVEVGFDPAGSNTYTEVFTRMPLQATGYAIRAKHADTATGATELAWSGLQDPTADLSLEHSTYTTLFNWATGTGTDDLFSLTSDASATGTGALMNIQTGTGSSLIPFRVRSGATEAIYVNSTGKVGMGTTSLTYKLEVDGDTNLSTGSVFRIGGASVLSSTTLGSGVTGSSLTSVGTLTGGIWNATEIGEEYGGTGQTGYAAGDILYASGIDTLAKRAIGTNNQVLTVSGGVPVWSDVGAASSVPFSGITSGTNTTAAMVVGTGASLVYNGGTVYSGGINSNYLLGGTWAAPGAIGSTTPNSGAFTTVSGTSGSFTTLSASTSVTTPLVIGTSNSLTLRPTTNAVNAVKIANAAGTAILSVDTTNSRVGIGTTAPSTQFHTTGGVRLAGITTGTETTAVMADVNGNLSTRALGSLAFDNSVSLAFLDLTDVTETSYTGSGGQLVAVNAGATGLEFVSSVPASSVPLSGITAATGANSISNGDNAQAWNWQLTTSDKVGFTFGESAASTALGSPYILSASTLATSTATPLYVKNLGSGASFRVDDELTDTTPFIIGAGGNVGIGTTTLTNKLEVAGNLNLSSGSAFNINGTSVLNATTLGTGVTGSSLTSVGTLTSGTWNATEIGEEYGGTGQTGYAAGDILYASGIDTLAKRTIGTAGQVLTVSAGLPVWTDASSVGDDWGSGTWTLAGDTGTQVIGQGETATVEGGTGITTLAQLTRKVTVSLDDTAVTVGSYGDSITVGTFTVDQQGRLTAAGNTTIRDASATLSGVVSTGTQTFAGAKTFSTSVATPLVIGSTSLALRPSVNATSGIQLQNATGINILNVDTTNSRIGIGTDLPSTQFHTTGGVRLAGITTGTETTAVMADVNGNLSTRALGSLAFDNSVSLAFLDLTDTPSAYTGSGSYLVSVNSTADGLEFISSSTLGGYWQRTSTNISPLNANDSVLPNTSGNLGSLSSRWGTVYGNTGSFATLEGNPTLTLQPSSDAINAVNIVDKTTSTAILSVDTTNSRVGIGTTSPDSALHVAGQVKITGGTPGANKVLTSDIAGLASWADLGSLGAVTSVTGTANQITASPTTGDVTLSIPTDFRAPGTVNAVSGIYTGATAGTQRIDGSGNLLNIGTITFTGGDVSMERTLANVLSLASGDSFNLVSGSLQVGGTQVITSGRLVRAANGSATTPAFSFSADDNTGMYSGGTDILKLATAGADRVTVLADGKMGVGTTSPGKVLDVAGDIRLRGDAATLNFYRDTSPTDIAYIKYDEVGGSFDVAANNKDIRFLSGLNWVESMRITSGGYVGIGTISPVSLFSVGATSQFQVDSSGDITKIKNLSYIWPTAHTTDGYLKNSGTGGLSWTEINAVQSTGTPYGTATAGPLAYWTSSSTIGAPTPYGLYWDDTNQYLGIGTNTPSAPLDIAGGTGGSLIKNSSGDITIEPAANLIISQGDVGIGTDTPLAKLHVKGNQILLKNEADADIGLVLDSGSTTTYRDVISFRDRGTDIFALEKTATNAFQLYDYAGTGVSRILVEAGTNSGISMRTTGTGDFSFINDTTTLMGITDAGIMELSKGLRINTSLSTKPTCDSSSRGLTWIEENTDGQDVLYICGKLDSGYEWTEAAPTWIPVTASGGSSTYEFVSEGNVYKIHRFNSSGTFTVSDAPTGSTVDVLVIAGGGGGGGSAGSGASGAGGGAGGAIYRSSISVSQTSYTITVGTGGSGIAASTDSKGGDGGNSSALGITSTGGGGGGARGSGGTADGGDGGSGGGVGSQQIAGWGIGAGGQGHRGGDSGYSGSTSVQNASGGGGGAGGVGKIGLDDYYSGDGGTGVYWGHIFGTSVGESGWFSGGGGGGRPGSVTGAQGVGGQGGGGDGGDTNGLAGTANTGGGGGGAGASGSSGAGGSGIVLIRYLIKKAPY